ncbi:MAG: RagB/SusD family nutrient uptake outer membrane protein [Bacteroides sp.]|nr:RagB/SusD family nutrient uptake outer membrane protein [Roseburia sp.]MCM1346284.1 RagB/SusD family nutrient uptake outer membrane protein [Bacteroides sp.]MCM1420861.1 RagB/SusD family nutrient uptake outer membrane protein [Bacteroides sp.]
MKKIYLALASVALTLASCDMDKMPEGSIPDKEALNTVADCESFRNGMYVYMRSITTGDYVILSDIQMDDFHAIMGNGNRLMDFYNGTILSNTSEIDTYYAGFYSVISESNFFISGVNEKLAGNSLVESDRMALNRYAGEVYFMRAFCYTNLADKFCMSYKNAADVDAPALGLSLQTVYAPTGDNTTYPGRSSLRATYELINNDLAKADSLLSLYEETEDEAPASMSKYITSDVVKALQARVYLTMGEDEKASEIAKNLINTNRYPLTTRALYNDLWLNDRGTEVLWQVEMDFAHQGNATGERFMSNSSYPDYIPTNTTVYLFEENDTRWDTFFIDREIENTGGKATPFWFCKYPGNPILYSGTNSNFSNISKPFRSAELYLIAAEAYYNQNEEGLANTYLSALQSARNLRAQTYTGIALRDEIRNERHREFIGEGFRMGDLKRWNIGFKRGEPQEGGAENVIYNSESNSMEYEADDYRFLWPIPSHELDANPQIKNQQNPGYSAN